MSEDSRPHDSVDPSQYPHADVAILVALKEEWEVLWRMAGSPEGRPDPRSGRYLFRFRVQSQAGPPYRCVALFVGEMGPGQAANAADPLLRENPRTLINVGIAAAIHPDLALCDVVVADQIDDYLSTVKATAGAAGVWGFRFRGSVYKPTHSRVQAVDNLQFAHRAAFDAWHAACAAELTRVGKTPALTDALASDHVRSLPALSRIHLASGPVLAASDEFLGWVRTRDELLKALEMEAAGMMLAAHHLGEPASTLVLRGISDFGDVRKASMDRASGGIFRHLAMFNATRLLWTMMEFGVLPRHDFDPPTGAAGALGSSPIARSSSSSDPVTRGLLRGGRGKLVLGITACMLAAGGVILLNTRLGDEMPREQTFAEKEQQPGQQDGPTQPTHADLLELSGEPNLQFSWISNYEDLYLGSRNRDLQSIVANLALRNDGPRRLQDLSVWIYMARPDLLTQTPSNERGQVPMVSIGQRHFEELDPGAAVEIPILDGIRTGATSSYGTFQNILLPAIGEPIGFISAPVCNEASCISTPPLTDMISDPVDTQLVEIGEDVPVTITNLGGTISDRIGGVFARVVVKYTVGRFQVTHLLYGGCTYYAHSLDERIVPFPFASSGLWKYRNSVIRGVQDADARVYPVPQLIPDRRPNGYDEDSRLVREAVLAGKANGNLSNTVPVVRAPNFDATLMATCREAYESKDLIAAESMCSRATNVIFYSELPWLYLGGTLSELGRHEEAFSAYTRALEFAPTRGDAYYGRGYVRHHLGEWEEACFDFEDAARNGYSAAGEWLAKNLINCACDTYRGPGKSCRTVR